MTEEMSPPVRVGWSDHDVRFGVTSSGGVASRKTLPLNPLLNTESFSSKTSLLPTRVGPLEVPDGISAGEAVTRGWVGA